MKGGLLTHMLVTREMTIEEIYANVTEMLLAGVDTVCKCVCGTVSAEGLGVARVRNCLCVCICVHFCVSVEFQRLSFWRHICACVSVPGSGQNSGSRVRQYPTDKLFLTQI